jgi:CheY-like chemotaxis protein
MAKTVTVLVVDDDDDVRDLAVAVLEASGYRVLAAADGEAALRTLAADQAVDVLFTDVVMPGLDGFALARLALVLRPELRVVYASGYFVGLVPAAPLLAKPYRPAQLAAEIGRVAMA